MLYTDYLLSSLLNSKFFVYLPTWDFFLGEKCCWSDVQLANVPCSHIPTATSVSFEFVKNFDWDQVQATIMGGYCLGNKSEALHKPMLWFSATAAHHGPLETDAPKNWEALQISDHLARKFHL